MALRNPEQRPDLLRVRLNIGAARLKFLPAEFRRYHEGLRPLHEPLDSFVDGHQREISRTPLASWNTDRRKRLSHIQAAFCTLPLRMQDVQARTRLLAPLTTARTVCRFTFQRRLETL